MYTGRTLLLSFFLATMTFMLLRPTPVMAQFDPPDNVTLTMYRLIQPGGERTDDLCTKDDEIARSYGCTADPNKPYPFDSSTITISIDGTNGPDNNQYIYPYLWDLTPQELDMNGSQGNKPLAAVKAQAIAARTYIYQRIAYGDQYGTPDNSNGFQVFLPYRYASLTPSQQIRVQTAATARLYLTEADSTYPIDAQFGADNPAQTITGTPTLIGTINYLRSVADPISASYGEVNGNGIGLSSKGASRWSFGHTSSRGPVAPTHPNYPHDDGGNGDVWSVRWDDAAQILTHYYTGIHLRDANAANAIVTPASRWVPLRLRWPTPSGNPLGALCAGSVMPLEVWVQNTGTTPWAGGGAITFGYRELPGLQGQAASPTGSAYPTIPVAPGGTYTATLFYQAPTQVADGHIAGPRFEMFQGGTPFSQLEPGKAWPDYTVQITISVCDKQLYLPLVQAETPVAGQ